MLGPIVARYLEEWGLEACSWDANYRGTGNGLLRIGADRLPAVWIVAHWDKISFLVSGHDERGYALTPFHAHMLDGGTLPGLALRYAVQTSRYEVVCRGIIAGGATPRFVPDPNVSLRAGDRIVYDTPMEAVDGAVHSGQIDNAASCAAALLAAGFLSRLPDTSVLIVFSDEEEGPVALGSTAFSRGTQRLLYHLPPPELAVVVEQHVLSGDASNPHIGRGAMIREFASEARGAVTPPWLYVSVRELASHYAPDILIQENTVGGLNRSDCVPLMHATPNIVHCGPPSVGRHYRDGPYFFSAFDVAHLARSLVMLCHHFAHRRTWDRSSR